VDPTVLALLARWSNFYVITGSAAAAITGLQFVVIVLGAQVEIGNEETTRVFGTPTIVHLSAVLLLSAILCAPWPSLSSAALAVTPWGVVGILYMLLVLRDARRQTLYAPVLEDWLWHVVLPLVAYGALVAGAFTLGSHPAASLFVVAGAALLLLFVGIHNAWDSVTFIAVLRRRRARQGDAED
jgi:hypothetical protein